MSTRLLLAPAAAGKTEYCLAYVRETLRAKPLTPVWILVPNRNQAQAFQRRLSEKGGVLGARVGVPLDLYSEILARAGGGTPRAPDALALRVVRRAIANVNTRGELDYFKPIADKPGLAHLLAGLFAELKRALAEPEKFTEFIYGRNLRESRTRLTELAALYTEYQTLMQTLNWADTEGMGWLAVEALRADTHIVSDWRLLIVDGFDSFNAVELQALQLAAEQAAETIITLSGDADMKRQAYRRFRDTLHELRVTLQVTPELLEGHPNERTALEQLERLLFETSDAKIDPENRITLLQAQNPRLEARAALRWLKARIVRDGVSPDACAVIAPDLAVYRPFLREAVREFELPIRFLGGDALNSNPALAALWNVLELTRGDWAWRTVVDALRSPYLNLAPFGLTPHDATRMAQVARDFQVLDGLEQWQEALDTLAQKTPKEGDADDDARLTPPQADEARRLGAALKALAARVTPPAARSLEGWIEWTRALAADDGGLGIVGACAAEEATAGRDLKALAVLGEELAGLVLAETVLGTRGNMTFETFCTELDAVSAGATYVPFAANELRQPHIYAGDVDTTRGLTYRAVAILGLSEGILPAPLTPDPFLDEETRADMYTAGMPIELRTRGGQQTLFYEAVTRAREFLLLTRPYLADDGEEWKPSPYWDAVTRLVALPPRRVRLEDTQTLTEAASRLEMLTALTSHDVLADEHARFGDEWARARQGKDILSTRIARQAQGEFEGDGAGLREHLIRRYGGTHEWSASRLEIYGACNFHFYLASALDLELQEAPEAGYDVAQRGTILHQILQETYARADPAAGADALIVILKETATGVLDGAPQQLGFRPTRVWERQRAEMVAQLEENVRALFEAADGFQPAALEYQFHVTLPDGLRVRGQIDRIDRNGANELRVMDYKSGSGGDKRALIEGRMLQLPLYAFAAAQKFNGQVVEGIYWSLNQSKSSGLKLSRFNYTDEESGREYTGVAGAIKMAQQQLAGHVQSIRDGRFQPAPPDGGCPTYCPAKLFCWRYTPR